MPNGLRIKSGALAGVLLLLSSPTCPYAAGRPAAAATPIARQNSRAREIASTLSEPLVVAWRRPNVGATRFAPVGAAGVAHLALAGGEVAAVQIATGATVWRDQFGGEISAQPAADGAGVFIATRSDAPGSSAPNAKGFLRLIGAASGLTRWVRELPRPLIGTLSVTETHVVAVDALDNLLAFDKSTGAPSWSARISSITTPVAIGGGMLYVGTKESAVCAVDERTGRTVWRRELNGKQQLTSIVYDASRLYIGANDGHVYAIDALAGNVLWKKRANGMIEHLAPIGNGVLAFSRASAVYKFEARRGGRVWKRQLPGRLTAPPIVDNGVVAVSPLSAGSCLVIDTRTGKIVNVIEAAGEAVIRSSFVGGRLLLLVDEELICYAPANAAEREP